MPLETFITILSKIILLQRALHGEDSLGLLDLT